MIRFLAAVLASYLIGTRFGADMGWAALLAMMALDPCTSEPEGGSMASLYRVTHREYRIQMVERTVNVVASDKQEAKRFARSGQGDVQDERELKSLRAGELTGYIDFECGTKFLPHLIDYFSVNRLGSVDPTKARP